MTKRYSGRIWRNQLRQALNDVAVDKSGDDTRSAAWEVIWQALEEELGDEPTLYRQLVRLRQTYGGVRPCLQSTEQPKEFRYFHSSVGALAAPSEHPVEDGRLLAQRCLESLRSSDFPPRLFVLWVTPAFAPFDELLTGIRTVLVDQDLDHVPLIGTSVSACTFDAQPHETGAVLICLASQHLDVAVARVNLHEQKAGEKLLKELAVVNGNSISLHDNPLLMLFLAGYPPNGDPTQYRAAEFVANVRRLCYGRLPMFGGVSSAGLNSEIHAVQIMDDEIYHDSVVGALINSNLSCGVGLTHGLRATGKTLHIKRGRIENNRIIHAFDEGEPQQVFDSLAGPGRDYVLRARSPDYENLILVPKIIDGAMAVQRDVTEDCVLEVMRPWPREMKASVGRLERRLRESFRIPNARVGAILAIGCTARYKYLMRNQNDFDLARSLSSVSDRYPGSVYIGCYMDGEIGVDIEGRSVLSNWSLTKAVIADDIPPRNAALLGLEELATRFAGVAGSVELAVDFCLEFIQRAGFSASMISLVFECGDKKWIVAQNARGGQWKSRVLPKTRRELPGTDVLAKVAMKKEIVFIRDATSDPSCDNETAREGNVYSFVAVPVCDHHGNVIGIVQIDLGDLRCVTRLSNEQLRLVRSVQGAVSTILNNAIRSEELRLLKSVDCVLTKAASANSVAGAVSKVLKGIANSIDTEGHFRLAQPSGCLKLIEGVGAYWKLAKRQRETIDPRVDPSSSATAFRIRKPVVQNDVVHEVQLGNENLGSLLSRYEGTRLGRCLSERVAFASFPLYCGDDDKPFGVMSFYSTRPWTFAELYADVLLYTFGRLRSMLMQVRHREMSLELRELCQMVMDDASLPPAERLKKLNRLVQQVR